MHLMAPRQFAFAVCAVLVCVAAPGPHAAAQTTPPQAGQLRGADFRVLNQTQVVITSIEVSRPEETSWGANRLGTATLAPGARFLVELPKDGKCNYDLRVKFRGGTEYEKRNLDTCKLSEFQMNTTGTVPNPSTAGGGTTTTPPAPAPVRVTIVNGFRRTIRELRVGLSSSTEWGNDRLGKDTVIAPQGRWELTLPAGQGCEYDLQARFDRASQQELQRVNLCTAGTVTFSGPRPGTIFAFGTGFRISAAGHLMTNNHVVQGCGSVAILAKETRFPLRMVGQDPVADLAVLQQPDLVTPFLSFRTLQSPVRLAERAIAIGYPIPDRLGDRVVTEGIVNALTGGQGDNTKYQLQTPIQPGNSGGPILDRSGLVIGVAVSGIDSYGGRAIQNANFAVSPSVAAHFAESLGVQVRYEQNGAELSTADVMDRDGDRVLQLVCLN